MLDLKEARKNIDAIDKQIVELFEKRMLEANAVAEYKRKTGKAVYDKEREEEKLEHLGQLSSNEFNKKAITELFSQIMSISRKYQYTVLPQTSKLADFKKAEELPVGPDTKVCYFGVPGAHTHQAMEDFFGEEITGISCPTFQIVMEAVEQGEADYGVLPIENSSTGGITANYDLLLNYSNCIVGQYVNRIEQCLLALPGVAMEELRTVYSHPQGLLQCSGFLKEHPELDQIEFSNTATAAKKVAEDRERSQAAIAAKRAAKEYGLQVLKEGIQQEKNNSTRFIVIGREPIYLADSNKIALCIELSHECGTLYRILSHFLFNGLNMTQIESRPMKGKNWEYRFFIDIEGNLEDPSVQNALRGIKEEAKSMRVLGNFKC
ncbi:MAG: prephenate dehydratase [Eubacterium sp.]|nr:prephenate dehydratase [Eubacterium sp.]